MLNFVAEVGSHLELGLEVSQFVLQACAGATQRCILLSPFRNDGVQQALLCCCVPVPGTATDAFSWLMLHWASVAESS